MDTDKAVRLLKEMVSIPSPSFHEDDVCSHICSFLSSEGVDYQRIANNIVARNRCFDPSMKTLMLCAHIDTVEACDSYDFDPYNPDYTAAARYVYESTGVSGPAVYGLGSNDDGASVVSMISAFMHFYDIPLPVNLMLVLSCEEERSGSGGMTGLWNNSIHADWAIVGEPTGMKAATSERGLLVLDGLATGTSGHAARNEGVNALYIAMDDIQRLRDYRFTKVSPLMGEVKMTVTQINAGSTHNVVPGECSFVVDIRPTEQYTNEEILTELQKICTSRLTPRNLMNRSSATFSNSALLEAIDALGIETFSSPTTSDWIRIDCDAIKMGPGDSSRSHKKNEFILCDEIFDAIDGYIRFIDFFCNRIQ